MRSELIVALAFGVLAALAFTLSGGITINLASDQERFARIEKLVETKADTQAVTNTFQLFAKELNSLKPTPLPASK